MSRHCGTSSSPRHLFRLLLLVTTKLHQLFTHPTRLLAISPAIVDNLKSLKLPRASSTPFAHHASRSDDDRRRQQRAEQERRLPTQQIRSAVRCSEPDLQQRDEQQPRKLRWADELRRPARSPDDADDRLRAHNRRFAPHQDKGREPLRYSAKRGRRTSLPLPINSGTRLTRETKLALKHRQNKSQHQRIIIFACSPISTPKAELDKLAKRLRKTSLNVDIVAFGDLDAEHVQKLESFNDNIKGPPDAEHQSHIVILPPTDNLLSDSLLSTPILGGHGGASGMGGAGGDEGGAGGSSDFPMGVDPNMDPELALAIRMSLEEEQRRAEREEREKAEKEGKTELEPVPEEKGEGSGDKKGGKDGDSMDTS